MRRPIIGISSYHRDGEFPVFSVPCGYVDALRAAGATPLVCPPGEKDPAHLLDVVDGIIFAGGGDVDPSHYGAEHHPTMYMISEERDRFEIALMGAALERPDIPMLCICRGLQVLNIVSGGTLHAHIPDRFADDIPHRLPPRTPSRHDVELTPGSRLADILGATTVGACSWHHQAIDRLGRELEAVGWSADGVIEAVEHQRLPWCFGVQWHPEMQHDEEAQMRLFKAFVAAAAETRPQRKGTR